MGRWSIRNEAGLAGLFLPGSANFIKCLADALALARATRGLADFEMACCFQHNKVIAFMKKYCACNNTVKFTKQQLTRPLDVINLDWYR